MSVAVLALLAVRDLASELIAHGLQTVTDAKDRNAELENRGIGQRRVLRVHAARAAAEDQSLGLERAELGRLGVVAQDLGEDVALADTSRNDLGVLRTEIENDDS